jgi:hypothetical protein
VTFTLKFRRPDALGPGTYFFRAAVDAASPLVESNEGDNAVTGTEPLVAP